ncbi:MAG: hypothetical protein LAO05_10185 [Acidobacteriia bacterium]|nr:hypothetical protein [Terriglobia bacterium]
MDHTPTRGKRLPVVMLILGGGLAAASCTRLLSSNAGAIAKNPAQYDGKTVVVSGKVKERIDMPLLKCYVLDDGTGAIGVVTKKPLPYLGATVRTEGKVNASFKIGRRSLIAVIEPEPAPTPRPKEPPPGPLGPG